MKLSEDVDQERRRAKRKRKGWAQVFLQPQTFKNLVTLGEIITKVLALVYKIIKLFWQ